ncbi:multicomponent Na+:H+ antiporter subunit B [Amaricoccus macauensis]|uniref:Multicomponent Na+:H+ antiporter subunit B n=1 Tax=Amaricoccus macauensis TaxID=57001 RepID=A0A840SK18_9RHOB|nr:MnhB domain-containing protein [Amaricoccus macauensis]MBB5220985.1 multicomponent Na+:H+ antiporter subunit B [Amaricoccus macauensis]
MNSLILTAATRVLVPVIVAFSFVVFMRGHNAPGGGFVGGLLAATAFALIAKARGTDAARRALHFRPLSIAAIGLACALASGFWGGIARGQFLRGMWPLLEATGSHLPLGSIPLFDLGVYLVVLGAVTGILFALDDAIEEDD